MLTERFLAKFQKYSNSKINQYSCTSKWKKAQELHLELMKYLPECKKVLDLGCGDGWSTNQLISMGYNAIGVTINPDEVNNALKTYSIDLILADMHDLPFDDKSFDCVYSRESLEHCVAPHIALCEMNRVLIDGGHTLINVPDQKWINEPSHHIVPSPAQMHEMLFKTKFNLEMSGRSSAGHYWYLSKKIGDI